MDKYSGYKKSHILGIEKIPNAWFEKRIKDDLEKIIIGKTPKSENELYWNSPDFNWFTPSDFKKDVLVDSLRKISKLGLASCGGNYLKKGDLVLTTRAPIGNVAKIGVDSYINQGCKGFSFKTLNHNFFFYFLKFYEETLKALGKGTTFKELSTKDFINLLTLYPPFSEQTAIANFLDEKTSTIDSAVGELENQRKLLKELKQATIHKAVTKGLDDNATMKDSGVEWIFLKNIEKILKRNNRIFKNEILKTEEKYKKPLDDIKNNIKLLNELKNVLINDAVTGKIKVYEGDV